MQITKDTAPALTLTKLCLSYQQKILFQDFTLNLPAAKTVAILGASGIGKSTLLRLIADLPTGATLLSSKLTSSDGAELATRIAYMGQQDLLLPWLSVLDNVLLGYRLRGHKKTPALISSAKELLVQVGLVEVSAQRPVTLSGGMRQRVALARTLSEEKPVLLMDEPFSALDALTRFRLQNLAAELLYDKTVLLVTHDPLEALRLADIVYVLQGSPATLGSAIYPHGKAPRDIEDRALLAAQAALLQQLGMNHE